MLNVDIYVICQIHVLILITNFFLNADTTKNYYKKKSLLNRQCVFKILFNKQNVKRVK